ncbi:ornithine cyclodeaminase [Aureobasidium namibiae CBS 147.97]|uniref:Ornithine cyclodeaminase n=1 Tax=Aureobasidium namibiae CBS 147.97 TaxID=1043004 RepID=A0A074WPV6_9PEZI
MKYISEAESRRLISHKIAFKAVREALIAAVTDSTSTVFPAVVAHASQRHNVFTMKSGTTSTISGLKVGSYWPENNSRGEPNHNTTILLLDQRNGKVTTVIEAGEVNAYRTAAADAVAASVLARPDSTNLAIFGAGHQAFFECLALSRVLPIRKVLVVARDENKAQRMILKLAEHNITAVVAPGAQQACEDADIVVTATPSKAPLFDFAWIKPGTHIACMGADSKGKQELPPELFPASRLFCDLPAQSRNIGEFQHCETSADICAIGDVLGGNQPGRENRSEITIFDSSGIALQDLLVAQYLSEIVA